MNVNYQFAESLKRHQISKPENFTKSQALNMLTQTQSLIRLFPRSLKNIKVKKNCCKIFNKNHNEKRWDGFMRLKEQSNIIQSVTIHCSSKEISRWQRLVKSLPINLHNFCRKCLVSSLANRTNLKRWKISENSNCELCSCPKTQLHIFNHCKLAFD